MEKSQKNENGCEMSWVGKQTCVSESLKPQDRQMRSSFVNDCLTNFHSLSTVRPIAVWELTSHIIEVLGILETESVIQFMKIPSILLLQRKIVARQSNYLSETREHTHGCIYSISITDILIHAYFKEEQARLRFYNTLLILLKEINPCLFPLRVIPLILGEITADDIVRVFSFVHFRWTILLWLVCFGLVSETVVPLVITAWVISNE